MGQIDEPFILFWSCNQMKKHCGHFWKEIKNDKKQFVDLPPPSICPVLPYIYWSSCKHFKNSWEYAMHSVLLYSAYLTVWPWNATSLKPHPPEFKSAKNGPWTMYYFIIQARGMYRWKMAIVYKECLYWRHSSNFYCQLWCMMICMDIRNEVSSCWWSQSLNQTLVPEVSFTLLTKSIRSHSSYKRELNGL